MVSEVLVRVPSFSPSWRKLPSLPSRRASRWPHPAQTMAWCRPCLTLGCWLACWPTTASAAGAQPTIRASVAGRNGTLLLVVDTEVRVVAVVQHRGTV